jgi:hypothetical protein
MFIIFISNFFISFLYQLRHVSIFMHCLIIISCLRTSLIRSNLLNSKEITFKTNSPRVRERKLEITETCIYKMVVAQIIICFRCPVFQRQKLFNFITGDNKSVHIFNLNTLNCFIFFLNGNKTRADIIVHAQFYD